MKNVIYILFAALLMAGVVSGQEIVAEYTFTGSSLVSTDLSVGTVASDFSLALVNSGVVSNAVVVSNSTTTLNAQYSTPGTQFFSFSITPGVGQSLSLTNMTFDYAFAFPIASGISVGVSTNGFATYDPDVDFADEVLESGGTLKTGSVDFALNEYSDTKGGTTVDFRFYFKRADLRNEPARTYTLDNIIVSGFVPVEATSIMIQ